MSKLNSAIRIGIGGMFVIAAILKLISVDEFEIYIYSFDIFGFVATSLLSRLLIAGELILGIFLIFKINYRLTRRLIFSVLIFFTLFLVYAAIFRNDDNCHCFGELVELNPIESIIKNVVLMILLLSQRVDESTSQRVERRKSKVNCKLLIVNCSLLAVFIISPPDIIYDKIFSSDEEISSRDLYESFADVVKIDFENETIVFDTTSSFNVSEGRQMIAIVSAGCKYCKIGVKKLSMMMERDDGDYDDVDIFIWGSPEGIVNFRRETLTEGCSYWHIMPNKAIDITYGRFPTFITINN